MRDDCIKWTPVRLEMTRLSNRRFKIERVGVVVGIVEQTPEGWEARPADWGFPSRHPSFRRAVLQVARYSMSMHSEGLQDHGFVRMFRVDCVGVWYTVLDTDHFRYIYEEGQIDRRVAGQEQARLRQMLARIERHGAGRP